MANLKGGFFIQNFELPLLPAVTSPKWLPWWPLVAERAGVHIGAPSSRALDRDAGVDVRRENYTVDSSAYSRPLGKLAAVAATSAFIAASRRAQKGETSRGGKKTK